MTDPEIDYARLARGQGWAGHGPVGTRAALDEALASAIRQVRGGGRVLVDIHVGAGT